MPWWKPWRGADIFSYMQAARRADLKYTLTVNWRSSPGLIRAINTIFSNVNTPFIFDEIPFEEGISVGKNDTGMEQAQIIKTHLSSRQIPSVLFSAGNIVHSHEAREMEIILSSISEPANERLFRAALATDIMGVAGQELDMQSQEPFWWQERLGAFREYFQLWRQYGLIRMFSRFMAAEKVRGRLLSFADGERRLTNVLHLTEVLYQESVAKNLGTTGLVRWLSEQRQTASSQSETHQLRLESDENAVKIITIHKSKGLEYPVVFCPFGWEGSTIKNKEIVFHDNTENYNLVLDLDAGQNSLHIVRAQNELLAENLRLLYVALTRAKKRCYLAWGCFKTAQTSAGFAGKWQAIVSTMLHKVLAAPLTSDPAPLTLSCIKPEDRINEMEFYFPLNPITPQKLKKIFEIHSDADISANFPRRVEKLSFSLAKGFMKGYIDLIIHGG